MEREKISLYCINYGQCDPRKCTAKKLQNLGFIQFIYKIKGALSHSIILNPLATTYLSHEDRERVQQFGLIVLDCSWKKVLTLRISEFSQNNSRRLPSLIATNPVNYGKWEKLTSAEALAAALYITGFIDQAKEILSKFRWGNEFWILNRDLLEKKEKEK